LVFPVFEGVCAAIGLGLVFAVLWSARRVCRQWLPGCDEACATVAAGVLTLAIAYVAFSILGALGVFRPIALGVVLGLAALALAALPSRAPEPRVPVSLTRADALQVGIVLLLFVVVMLPRIASASIEPPLGWDDQTYHLFRAGRWVQTGSIAPEPGPDTWGYYDFFPLGGDAIWALCAVWSRSDVLVPLASVGSWLAIGLAGFAIARRANATAVESLLFGAALLAIPATRGAIGSAYVDNVLIALYLAGFLLLAQATLTRDLGAWFLASLAMNLAFAVRPTASFAIVGAVGLLAWETLRRRAGIKAWLAFALGVIPAIAGPVRAWLAVGEPLYPFAAGPLGQGNALLARTLAFRGNSPELGGARLATFARLFLPDGSGPFLGVGFGTAILAVAAALAIRRSKRDWPLAIAASAASALMAAAFFSPSNAALYTVWSTVAARHLIPVATPIFLLAPSAPPRARQPLFAAAAIAGLAYGPFKGIAPDLMGPALAAIGVLLIGAGVVLLGRRLRGRLGSIVALLITLPAALTMSQALRDQARPVVFALAAKGQMFQLHKNQLRYMTSQAWASLDGEQRKRVLFVARSSGFGHDWFRAPLLGARLQNEVVFVSNSRDGRIPSYFDPGRQQDADLDAWLRRVDAARIDVVVVQGASTHEASWIRAHPELFETTVTSDATPTLIASVRREAVQAAGRATQR
jgi:hypothetical protein